MKPHGATDARKIVEKHRLHVEASPGVGEDVQGYALAVCDDILFDLDHQTPVSERVVPTQGAYRWIESACDLLREWLKACPTEPRDAMLKLVAESDALLSGVPCPQVDLGFNSPADREARLSATARKPKECEQGCPPRQVCDYCQNVNAAPGKGDGRYSSPDQSIDSPARPAGNAPVAAPLSQSDKDGERMNLSYAKEYAQAWLTDMEATRTNDVIHDLRIQCLRSLAFAVSSVAGYEMTATRVELTRRAQSIIGSMRSIYEVPESMIDELRRLDEAFHAPRSATREYVLGEAINAVLSLTDKEVSLWGWQRAVTNAIRQLYVSGGSGG